MTEATGTAFCFIQDFYLFPFCLFVTSNYHLGNAFAIFNYEDFG